MQKYKSKADTAEQKKEQNRRALEAAKSAETKNQFLLKEEQHILRLTGKVLRKSITMSDDEWAVSLLAVSEAIDKYDESKGDFWGYAAVVIKSRVLDWYRSQHKAASEMIVRPEAFAGQIEEDAPDYELQKKVSESTCVSVDTTLKDEIEALSTELAEYGIGFFELAECSPKSEKTKKLCSEVVSAFLSPPPLTEELKKGKCFPVKSLLLRIKVSKKSLDRYRKYLISVILIIAGDYPALADYIPFFRRSDR